MINYSKKKRRWSRNVLYKNKVNRTIRCCWTKSPIDYWLEIRGNIVGTPLVNVFSSSLGSVSSWPVVSLKLKSISKKKSQICFFFSMKKIVFLHESNVLLCSFFVRCCIRGSREDRFNLVSIIHGWRKPSSGVRRSNGSHLNWRDWFQRNQINSNELKTSTNEINKISVRSAKNLS